MSDVPTPEIHKKKTRQKDDVILDPKAKHPHGLVAWISGGVEVRFDEFAKEFLTVEEFETARAIRAEENRRKFDSAFSGKTKRRSFSTPLHNSLCRFGGFSSA